MNEKEKISDYYNSLFETYSKKVVVDHIFRKFKNAEGINQFNIQYYIKDITFIFKSVTIKPYDGMTEDIIIYIKGLMSSELRNREIDNILS